MLSPFERIYPDKRSVSPGDIQFMLKLFQQDRKTALVEISYPTNHKIFLLFHVGKIISSYLAEGEHITRSTSSLMESLAGRGQGVIRVCELAPSFLGALKTILEQKNTSSMQDESTAALSGVIQNWQTAVEPSLIHILWPNAEGFVFIPGNNFSARQYGFVADGNPIDSAAAVSMFSRWPESKCQVARYVSDPQIAVWQENHLRLGFALLVEQIMRRYQELVGTMLSRKLEDSLNRFTQLQSWSISIAGSAVDDVQFFDSIQGSASAYRSLFDLASRQINQVIGGALFNQAVDASMNKLGAELQQSVAENHIAAVLSASLSRG